MKDSSSPSDSLGFAVAPSLSQAASEQAASVEEISANIDPMSESISQNSDNAKVTDGMATTTSKEAVVGGGAVSQTVTAMKQIAVKIGIVDDIADQTNLLALNAAIETASAERLQQSIAFFNIGDDALEIGASSKSKLAGIGGAYFKPH